jgi:type IV secretory pathway TraG/TraD family ATPase VirD4
MKRQLDATGDRDNLWLAGGATVLAAVGVGGAWVSLHLAAVLTDRPRPARDPLRLVIGLVTGEVVWTSTATMVAAGLAVALLVVVFLAILAWPKSRGKRMRSDRSARHMGRGADVDHLTAAGSARTGKRLGAHGPGLPLGQAVAGRKMLHTSWEDMAILVAGPRTQKTTAYAIPALLAAPGAALATSNKRDLYDATHTLRAQQGRVWVFDAQGVTRTPASWYWDPLSYIAPRDSSGRPRRLPSGEVWASETRAERLAAQLITSARPVGAKVDAYFDTEAENLIGLMLLAAACTEQPMTVVYTWLSMASPEENDAADLLRANGFLLQAQAMKALAGLPDKQREGVYGTARSLLTWLRNRDVAPWITPGPAVDGTVRQAFDPVAFASSTDTLYPLSKEGVGSVGPLVAALTMAGLDALEDQAAATPTGRLTVPFVGVLDEAANICRIRGLDAYYSHFGSRGIVLLTILQSWAQGAEAWGTHGMEKLWSSANARIYGGGVDDPAFLRRLSDLIGETSLVRRSATVSKGGRSVSRTVQRETILTPAELRELPQGRAVLFASGTPAILTHPVPWWEGPHATTIHASLAQAAV